MAAADLLSSLPASFPTLLRSARGSQDASDEWKEMAEAASSYGIPQGCVVRNTFLEWQDPRSSAASDVAPEIGRAPRNDGNKSMSAQHRGRSCPANIMGTPLAALAATGCDASSDGHSGEGLSRETSPPDLMDKGESHVFRHRKGTAYPTATSVVILRGLPFTATEEDVAAFIEEAGMSRFLAPFQPITLLINPQGKPSGFAEIALVSTADFWELREKLHMQRLGGRYIEVLQSRATKPVEHYHRRAGGQWRRSARPRRETRHQ